MHDTLRIGVAGLGVVGSGLVSLLEEQNSVFENRCGKKLKVVAVSAKNSRRISGPDISRYRWFDDPIALAEDPEVDVVCELIGGMHGVAFNLSKLALARGKHLVTANKALLAQHGIELAKLAEASSVHLGYEAAVGGGIPIIKTLREGLCANNVFSIYGILNGTCNYILTKMHEGVGKKNSQNFEDVLKEAQELGYAESDPSTDIDGIDSAHKLAMLTSLAFGCPVDLDSVHTEGIRDISVLDMQYAVELGYRIKLLAIAKSSDEGVDQSVHPCMVPEYSAISKVGGVLNAVVIKGNYVGTTTFEGPGAGALPTASAVTADLMDIARGVILPTFAVPVSQLNNKLKTHAENRCSRYYIRLTVLDQSGVIADITSRLRDLDVSVDAMIQHSHEDEEAVPVVLTTHLAKESTILRALGSIAELSSVIESPRMFRIAHLE